MPGQSCKTIVADTDDPRKKSVVDLPYEEVLEAVARYISDKKFEQDLDAVYNGDHISSWDYWSEGEIK